MAAMEWIYLIAFVAVAVAFVLVAQHWYKRYRDLALLRERVHLYSDRYVFLIDQKFRVKETNFYNLHEDIADDQPYILGNIIHCQTAVDEGFCGTGENCDSCPIRMVIKNAFKQKRNFDHLEAVMHLYDAHHKKKEVDVMVGGELVSVGKQPYFFVKVKKINQENNQQNYYDI